MKRHYLLGFALLSLMALPTRADEPLAWKFKPGQEFQFRCVQDSTSVLSTPAGEAESLTKQTVQLSWKVERVREDGAAELTQDIRRIQLDFDAPGGQTYAFDTQAEEPPQGLAALIAPLYQALVEHDTRLTISPRGKFTGLTPPEEVQQVMKNLPGAAALGGADAVYKQLLQPVVIELPEGPVSPGQTWTSNTELPLAMLGIEAVRFTYEYLGERQGDSKPLAAIGVKLEIVHREQAPNAVAQPAELRVTESDGEVLFDREAGRVHSGKLSSNFALTLRQGDQQTTGEIRQATTIGSLPEEPAP